MVHSDLADVRRLPSALQRRGEIFSRLGRRPPVFLDYDGTLTSIAPHPAQAVLSNRTRAIVQRLADRCFVAIVSGRNLSDLQDMVQVEEITYAGSHGFDICLPDGRRIQGPGESFLAALDIARGLMDGVTKGLDGAWVERKRFAVTIHFRQMDQAYLPELKQRFAEAAARAPDLRSIYGKQVLELRPDVAWDKGAAIKAIMKAWSLDPSQAPPLFMGDDVTDEDALITVLSLGVGIVVGEDDRLTAASYFLRDPLEVSEFLTSLSAQLG